MTHFMITMTGLLFLGMTGLAMGNPAMLPQHPGYPSSGEFANDTGSQNLTYRQSIEKAAKSGDTTMGAMPSHGNSLILNLQDVNTSKGTVDQREKQGVQMPNK